MSDNIDELKPEKRVAKLKDIIDKKNHDLELEKKRLEAAEKQSQEEKVTEAILKRQKELDEEEFEVKNKKDDFNDDLSNLLLDDEKDLESKLQGLRKENEEIVSMYMSSKSPIENIYNDIKALYNEAQTDGVSPAMAEIAGNVQYALEQKYEDVKSGEYNSDESIASQADSAKKIANDILSMYTGPTKQNDKLRRY